MPSNLSPSTSSGYGDVRTVKMSFDDAVARTEGALKNEGFAVLCQIDIQAKLKEKLGVDFPRYVILGACNPARAQQALERDMNLGLLLPCNAVVYEEGGQVHMGDIDAARMLSVANHPEMGGLARHALDSVTPKRAPVVGTSKSTSSVIVVGARPDDIETIIGEVKTEIPDNVG